MSAIGPRIYYNDSLWIVMWDHRPPGRFAPHDEICDILRAAIKSRISADMLSLRIWYSVIIHITYSLLHTCNFFQMLIQINRSNWGHLQKGALCPMLLYTSTALHSVRRMLYHQWAYSTGQVPSHTFLLIGRFLQFCIRLAPEMKQCEIRKNGRWTQRYCVSNVSTTIITWSVCYCLIAANIIMQRFTPISWITVYETAAF